jgi:phospho-N-acetylmuramoyl-pentapeptide-transferase
MFRNKSYYSNFVLDDYLSLDTSILISSVAGACLGFLWWNTNPAKIILGDVGSHFIGSIIVLLLISISAEGLTLLICMIFIVEALSVVLQIVSYKLRKKRIFKMAPIHHHFEMCGWAETTVIVRFWILNGIFVILALGLFYADWVLYGN